MPKSLDVAKLTKVSLNQEMKFSRIKRRVSSAEFYRTPEVDIFPQTEVKQQTTVSPAPSTTTEALDNDIRKQNDFQRQCEVEYGGVADGTRCFFHTPNMYNWYNAWTACDARNATLAQILTSTEFNKLSTLKPNTLSKLNAWIAGKRTQDFNEGNCRIPASVTFWYEDPNTFNPQMVFSNTYFKSRSCDYPDYDGAQCSTSQCTSAQCSKVCQCAIYQIWNGPKFVAWDCSAAEADVPTHALCQRSNPDQVYAFVKNTCLGETPVETVVGATLKDCRRKCRTRRWCRSFNYINDSICQLFTWSIVDSPKLATVAAGSTCQFYNYVA